MPGAEKKWDTTADIDLCVAIILSNQENERIRYNWPKVHECMAELGHNFTKEAISQHFTKFILKDFKKRRETEGASPAPPPKKATPRKRNPRKRPAPVEDDSEESDEVEAKTEKKEKKEKKPKLEGSVKSEEEGDSHHTRERSATVAEDHPDFAEWLKADGDDEE